MALQLPLVLDALQQPEWPDHDQLRDVCDWLAESVAPVDVPSCRALLEELDGVALGEGFVVMGGDCAELFQEVTPACILEKAKHLHRVADNLTTATRVPTTRIGRFGGQFAKPRSQNYEELPGGHPVLSYRGDAVNGLAPHERTPDPTRLLTAHRCTSDAVHTLREWDRRRWATAIKAGRQRPPRTYLGHEALLLDYERALLRHNGRHASSGHYLWIGDRTRHPDRAHVAFAAAVDNPIAVKLGPSVEQSQVRALVEILDPEYEHRPGRLSFIVRMGAAHCERLLPQVIEALGPRARDVLWILDPMHGNGRVNRHGQKTRVLTELGQEIRVFFTLLIQRGLWPGGVHLEITPDHVTECVDRPSELDRWLPGYRSACDPRLNPAQTESVMELVAELLNFVA